MTLNLQDAPLLIVAVIVFGGAFLYLWRMDARVRSLEAELRDELMIEAQSDVASSRGKVA